MFTQSSFQNLINLKAEWLFLHQQDSFDDDELMEELRKYALHIYLIGRTPSIKLDNTQTIISEHEIFLVFYTHMQGTKRDIPITIANDLNNPVATIDCDYPFNLVKAYCQDGSVYSIAKSSLLLRYLSAQQNTYLDEFNLEVLYVGQAFGENGSRITVDRLKTHEKAQRIYFDTQQKFPDYEVWFLGITFAPLLMTMFKPWGNVNPDSFEKELSEQENLVQTPIPFDQQITVAEAALIKYFNTYEYNKEYLNFPSPEHKSYQDIYTLDFNSAGIEITSHSVHTKLWSKSKQPAFSHYQSFFLHDESERKSMFKWYEEK